MKRFRLLSAGLLALLGSASAANAVIIDFEGYADPTVFVGGFTDSGATFTALDSTTTFTISDFGTSNWGTGAPNILCPNTAGNDCPGNFQISFAGIATGLNFLFTGDNSTTPLSVEAFLGATSLGTTSVNGDGNALTAHLVDLSAFGGIDRIVLNGAASDPAGFGYDDFSFTLGDSAIPEPATWGLMIVGFGLAGAALRRRKGRVLSPA